MNILHVATKKNSDFQFHALSVRLLLFRTNCLNFSVYHIWPYTCKKERTLLEFNQENITGSTLQNTTIQHEYKTLTYNCINTYMGVWNVRPVLNSKTYVKCTFHCHSHTKQIQSNKSTFNSTHTANILINAITLYILQQDNDHIIHPLQKGPHLILALPSQQGLPTWRIVCSWALG